MAKKQNNREKDPVEILHLTTPTGGKRFGIQNNRTGFVQVVRRLRTACDIRDHWAGREAIR